MAMAHDDPGARVQAHYRDHLGPIYEWLAGGFDAALAAARADLAAVGLPRGVGRHAVDLGAGLGAHALALAACGYAVTAIDTCAPLVDSLRARTPGGPALTVVHDDLGQLRRHCVVPQDVVLCLGDTLTHLASEAAVDALMDAVAGVLAPGGVFVATFRDYSLPMAPGIQRVIPGRQDDRRILTCVLEFTDTRVIVHDLVHERSDTGWSLRVSRYPKLRLPPERPTAALEARGLTVRRDQRAGGMVRLVAARRR